MLQVQFNYVSRSYFMTLVNLIWTSFIEWKDLKFREKWWIYRLFPHSVYQHLLSHTDLFAPDAVRSGSGTGHGRGRLREISDHLIILARSTCGLWKCLLLGILKGGGPLLEVAVGKIGHAIICQIHLLLRSGWEYDVCEGWAECVHSSHTQSFSLQVCSWVVKTRTSIYKNEWRE